MRRAHYIWIALVLKLGVVSGAAALDKMRIELIEPPVSETASSLTPHLAGSADALYLSWLEVEDEGHALKVSGWDGDAFGPARTVHASDRFFANWADFASVLPLPSGRLVVHWLEKAADGTYEYDVWVSTSDDQGRTWSEPIRPHTDGTLSEHGFVSMVARGDNGFAAVWLDGREFVDPDTPRQMTLRFSEHDGAGFAPETLLDGRVCECCQTAMASTDDGLVVLYRDRSPEEIRDIGVVRLVDKKWTAPEPLHEDGWHLTGCPVNGPQVASNGNRLAAVWFTGAGDEARVQVVFSEDGGASFGAPVRIDDGQPVGRVDVIWGSHGDALVSWTEQLDGREGHVVLKRVAPDGGVGPGLSVARTGSSRASGFPRMASVASKGQTFVAWTESYDRKGPSRVRVGRLVDDVELTDEPSIPFTADALDGSSYALSDLSGRVVVLNFWGIWCTSCRDEIPKLVVLDERFRDRGLTLLGADYGDDLKDLPGFVRAQKMTYPILVEDALADDYQVTVFPTTIVIDRSGRLRYRSEGYTEKSFAALTRVIERLLEES